MLKKYHLQISRHFSRKTHWPWKYPKLHLETCFIHFCHQKDVELIYRFKIFQDKYQCHLAEIYRLYQIFTNSDFRSHGFCLSNRSSLFTSQFASWFPSLDSPRCSDLGSFLWPGCSTNETHGTTGVAATSVPRWFSAWLFFCAILGVPSWNQVFQSQTVWRTNCEPSFETDGLPNPVSIDDFLLINTILL